MLSLVVCFIFSFSYLFVWKLFSLFSFVHLAKIAAGHVSGRVGVEPDCTWMSLYCNYGRT